MASLVKNLFTSQSPSLRAAKTGVDKDPLRVSTSQAALATLGTMGMVFDCAIAPALSVQTAGLFQSGLFLMNLCTDAALTYQAYTELNPQTAWDKGMFIATSLASIPAAAAMKSFPTVKKLWDLSRVALVAKRSVQEIRAGSAHYAQDKWKGLKHFAANSLSLASAVCQTRDSLRAVARKVDEVFTSVIKFPFASAESVTANPGRVPPFTKDLCMTQCLQRESCQSLEVASGALLSEVEQALKNGGRLVHFPSSSGVYQVVDKEGGVIAYFKPTDERNCGPFNRDFAKRCPDPTYEQIHAHQMSSFEQGNPAARQAIAQEFDYGCFSKMPVGLITKLESDQFVDPLCSNTTACFPRNISKSGFLQRNAGRMPRVIDFDPEAVAMLARGDHLPFDKAYNFGLAPIMGKVPLDEFQKIGILDVLLYNEDRNMKNVMVDFDREGAHLIPIDHDSILPFRLQKVRSVFHSPRTKLPFCKPSLDFIESLDPRLVSRKIRQAGIGEQAAINGGVLAMVLQKFAAAGKTLADIYRFVSIEPSLQESAEESPVWTFMKEARQSAIAQLPQEDRAQFDHNEYLRWALVNKVDLPQETGLPWMEQYNQQSRTRIEGFISDRFWQELVQRVDTFLS